jgi:hypothetical protein
VNLREDRLLNQLFLAVNRDPAARDVLNRTRPAKCHCGNSPGFDRKFNPVRQPEIF